MTTRKHFLGLALAASTLAMSFGFAGAQESDILLGATVPITGPLSLTGKQYHNALQMAEKDINAAGGINGRNLKIVFEDTQASNGTAVNAFMKLAQEVKPPLFFLSSYSTQNLAVSPEQEKVAVPAMYAGGANAIAERGNEWMFRIRPADQVSALGMVEAAKLLEVEKPGILFIQNDFGQGGAQVAEEQFRSVGISVVGMEAYGQNDKDFSAQILSLRSKGADAILLFNYPQDGALILRQMKMLGIEIPLIASSSAFVPAVMQLISELDLENVWGVVDTFMSPTVGGPMEAFITRYRQEFGIDPDPYGLAYYDGAMIAAEGMRQVGTDPEALRNWMLNLKDWQGVGHVYSFDEKGNGVHDVAIIKVKPGTKDLELVRTLRLD